ncbi:hypothetical protein [Leptolinea tardivitalis]|uniref:hypothetical protein n=1 Tax=Leptolinea tardivitalis TaxID=229920 RepID=UPI00130E68D1|nr:hypothetical protein [Leptolinea tardivitalis]GAP22346.1 hypothetical protein LTAR_02577 [Leptolinea tardivitalis]
MDQSVNTGNYFVAGYVVILVLILAYAASLFVRWKKLQAEWDRLIERKKLH